MSVGTGPGRDGRDQHKGTTETTQREETRPRLGVRLLVRSRVKTQEKRRNGYVREESTEVGKGAEIYGRSTIIEGLKRSRDCGDDV